MEDFTRDEAEKTLAIIKAVTAPNKVMFEASEQGADTQLLWEFMQKYIKMIGGLTSVKIGE